MSASKPKEPKSFVHLAWAARAAAPTQPAADHPSDVAKKPPHLLRPKLRPLPQLPLADKSVLQAESKMRVAVALDVICSATRKISPGPTVLVQATRAWLSLRGRHHDAQIVEALVAQAQGPQAVARARISGALTRLACGASNIAAQSKKGASAPNATTTPHSVHLANRRIEAAAQVIVAEMILWLESRRRVDYRRG